ncbi:MAG: hypothetical protein EHM45_22380 [Desulfobacteraceae bacterium]|nr:MAG: hypothetical protein EHM45_22380 [Desulfobacteraceae bacterium]
MEAFYVVHVWVDEYPCNNSYAGLELPDYTFITKPVDAIVPRQFLDKSFAAVNYISYKTAPPRTVPQDEGGAENFRHSKIEIPIGKLDLGKIKKWWQGFLIEFDREPSKRIKINSWMSTDQDNCFTVVIQALKAGGGDRYTQNCIFADMHTLSARNSAWKLVWDYACVVAGRTEDVGNYKKVYSEQQ